MTTSTQGARGGQRWKCRKGEKALEGKKGRDFWTMRYEIGKKNLLVCHPPVKKSWRESSRNDGISRDKARREGHGEQRKVI